MQEIRIDKVSFPKISLTKEGYMKGEAIVTRTGVYEYKNLDGTIRRELRHPEDILIQTSLDTLKTIPITNDHPTQLVNCDNVGDLMVGMTGETVKVDGNFIITSVNITHKDGINAINRGKRELSLGYSVDVAEETGIYNGEIYTHRQSNVKYNHLAIVEIARAGRSARINLDGALIQHEDNLTTEEDLTMNKELKEIKNRLDKMEEENEEKKEEESSEEDQDKTEKKQVKKDMQDRLDKAEAIIDQLKIENAELKAMRVDSIIAERVKKRIQLLSKASKVINTDDNMFDKTDREIMELTIKTSDPAFELKERSDAYIEGRFDAIVDTIPNDNAIRNQMLNLVPRQDAATSGLTLFKILQSHSTKEGLNGRI